MIFCQTPEPGHMALSDFTDAGEFGGTIAGAPFPHRLLNVVMAYNGWQHTAHTFGFRPTAGGPTIQGLSEIAADPAL